MYSIEITMKGVNGNFTAYNDDCVEVLKGYCNVDIYDKDKIDNSKPLFTLRTINNDMFLIREDNFDVLTLSINGKNDKSINLYEDEAGNSSKKFKDKLIKFLGSGNVEFFLKQGRICP